MRDKIHIWNNLTSGQMFTFDLCNIMYIGGVAEGHPRFDKGGGVAIIFYFLRVKT